MPHYWKKLNENVQSAQLKKQRVKNFYYLFAHLAGALLIIPCQKIFKIYIQMIL